MTRSLFTVKYKRFREALVGARLSKKLSQAQLAAKIRRPQSFISKYERGERRLDVIEFLQVTEALGIEPRLILEKI